MEPVQAVITNTVVLRGRYQTLPVALYGWTIALEAGQQRGAQRAQRGIEYSATWQAPPVLPPTFAGGRPASPHALTPHLFARWTLLDAAWHIKHPNAMRLASCPPQDWLL